MNSNDKGKRGERELSSVLREFGFDCRRTQQYCGKTGDASDVIGLDGIHIECKRTEKLNLYDAINQAKRDNKKESVLPVVFHRKNNCEWLVIMEIKDWMQLYQQYTHE